MFSRILHVTSFKKVADLMAEGNEDKAKALLEKLQAEYMALCEENRMLKTQLREAAEVLDLAENMEFDGQKYWLIDDLDKKGPYCQLCYDRDGLLIHLQELTEGWKCNACNSTYVGDKKKGGNGVFTGGRTNRPNRVIPLFAK